ncbi:hypothetical protein PENANT_c044G02114 [Penicillium antarcticum]|uniref:SigF-like NTF2-like domain-containing protein n=1 Tax=Penicillium antarcticum TaxID=416450 RepID=A0A1V6PRZ3_9EURO|nr:uncharacterized protein N7508_003963 [Penicillium antarcticum]KAJ5308584.1 hypothetical protein N7508_003963 [Penicillium antarcticum]OQD79800.1 hypothetical protein PENANT_c044G02114 [Penicillium antarcticum]
MENPVAEISTVIRLLTQSPPSLQETVLERFFTNNASFVHPFCRVPSFHGSRWWVAKIFQWYKIMSPRIELEVHSIAFDEEHLKLYVNMSQIFSIWVVPFHVATATLTTVLDLTVDSPKSDATTNGDHSLYYITKQEDLYQTSEFIKFLMPHIGHWLVFGWHLVATLFCVLGVTLLWPILWLEEKRYIPGHFLRGGNLAYNMDKKISEIKE